MRIRGNYFLKCIDFRIGAALLRLLGFFAKKNPVLPSHYSSIFIIKLSAIGDTILLMPAIKAIRSQFPNATITVMGSKVNHDILSRCPYIDRIISLSIPDLFKKPVTIVKNIRSIRPKIVIDFDQWLRITPLLAFASGAPYRIGFKTTGQKRHFLYTHYADHDRNKHELMNFMQLLKPLGIEKPDTGLEFRIDPDDEKNAQTILREIGITENDSFVLIHPETPAHGIQRQWPGEWYKEVSKQITAESHYKTVISGTKMEFESNSRLFAGMAPDVVILPPVSLSRFAAVMKKSALLLCGNTGIMHLACALNVPVIALHGPTNPHQWGPLGKNSRAICSKLKCSPCLYLGFEYGCSKNSCMKSITVDMVVKEIWLSLSNKL